MSSEADRHKPFIVWSRPDDMFDLAGNMRQCDVDEVRHSSGLDPWAAVESCWAHSHDHWTIIKDGRVVAMFGVGGKVGMGIPWMLGTDELKSCKSLLRECRRRLDEYLKEYRYLTNRVWSKNEVHIQWLKWLGFIFEGSSVSNGETFLHFHRSAPDV